jgi:16S rRNA processing protein RimM
MTEEFDPETAVTVGVVIGAHGIRGEVKVQPQTDFPERFRPGARLWIDSSPLEIETARFVPKLVYVKLIGVENRADAEALRGRELTAAPFPSLPDKDAFYRHEVIGLKVCDLAGVPLGVVADILSTGSNDVYAVRGERGELLLPATDEVVHDIDIKRGVMTVDVLEGLEWERPRRPAATRPRGRRPGRTKAQK